MKEFKDKVAVVTGAASGIGRAMAERFAAAGMKLVLADLEETPLNEAVNELKKKTETIGVLTDVSKLESIEALAKQTLDTFGGVHVLCNNAGVSGEVMASWRQSLKTWEWVIGVNLWSVIYGVKTFLPIMIEQNSPAHIVNTASMAGLVSLPYGAPYHVTKHGVVTLSESLHFELAMENAPVKVSVLCPGWVKTKIAISGRNRPEELKSEELPKNPAELGWIQAVGKFVESGLSTAEVAEMVFNAIQEERFYILTHPEMLTSVRARAEAIVENRNPVLDPPRMPKEG